MRNPRRNLRRNGEGTLVSGCESSSISNDATLAVYVNCTSGSNQDGRPSTILPSSLRSLKTFRNSFSFKRISGRDIPKQNPSIVTNFPRGYDGYRTSPRRPCAGLRWSSTSARFFIPVMLVIRAPDEEAQLLK